MWPNYAMAAIVFGTINIIAYLQHNVYGHLNRWYA